MRAVTSLSCSVLTSDFAGVQLCNLLCLLIIKVLLALLFRDIVHQISKLIFYITHISASFPTVTPLETDEHWNIVDVTTSVDFH